MDALIVCFPCWRAASFQLRPTSRTYTAGSHQDAVRQRKSRSVLALRLPCGARNGTWAPGRETWLNGFDSLIGGEAGVPCWR